MKKVNVKIKPIGLFDLLAFKNIVPNRVKRFQAASDSDVAEQNINKLAKRLHPQKQEMVIKEIIERGKGVKTFRLKRKDGENPAYFRAGAIHKLKIELGRVGIHQTVFAIVFPRTRLTVLRHNH